MNLVIINALQFSKNGAGISKYTQKLCEYMNNDVDVIIQNDVNDKNLLKKNIIKVKNQIKGSKERILQEQIKSLKVFNKYKLVHFPDYAIPIMYRGKRVATIHDMAMHSMEDKYTKSQVFTKKVLMKYTIKNADKLICISKFTVEELKKYYPYVDESKIEVVYNGFEYNPIKLNNDSTQNVLNKFNLDKKYFLNVGTLSPHKNVERLIEAFSKIKAKGYDYKLVIAGKKGWLYEDIFKKVKQLNLENDVIFTGYIMDEELEVLYCNAEAFVFPSLYEGFGFPPIEAMARSIPVITSNEGALPEVVGEAALKCDAYNTEDICNKMIEIVNNEELRKILIEKGIERSKYFSWEKTANQTYKIYKNLLNNEE